MKLLFNQHLSPRLVQSLIDLFPDSAHVSNVGLDRATDLEVWQFGAKNDFAIVTKDSDFNDFSVFRGFPPKVIWLRIGNCTTTQIEQTLRSHVSRIIQFEKDQTVGVLELF